MISDARRKVLEKKQQDYCEHDTLPFNVFQQINRWH